jgi:hypothetical protein
MNASADFQLLRKRAIVCGAFAAALSAVAASTISEGHQYLGLIVIGIQAFLIVLAVLSLFRMKGASKAA